MSWAADGQDGNGLHLEKMRLRFSSLYLLSRETRKNFDDFLFSLVNSLDIFLLVFHKYVVYGKGT